MNFQNCYNDGIPMPYAITLQCYPLSQKKKKKFDTKPNNKKGLKI